METQTEIDSTTTTPTPAPTTPATPKKKKKKKSSEATQQRAKVNGKAHREMEVRGRKDGDGQDKVIEPKVLKARMPELIKLKKAADAAAVEYSDAVKAAAEKSGFLATVVRKTANALASEEFEEAHRVVQQLELAFDTVA